jgi:hypothetical protein
LALSIGVVFSLGVFWNLEPHGAKECCPSLGKIAVREGLLFELGLELRVCLLCRQALELPRVLRVFRESLHG